MQENRIGNATTAHDFILAAAIGVMTVAGCGFGAACDGLPPREDSAPAIDVSALKEAALSSLAEGAQHVVKAGGGCMAELTIDPTLQRVVSETLCRYADTNDTGVGWAILMSVNDGAVLALADCGGAADAPRPFALTRLNRPGHLLSTFTVAAAIDAGIATPDTELFSDDLEAFYYQCNLPGDGGHIWESMLSVSNALVYSSDVVLVKLGMLVGRDRAYDVLNKFGIGTMSGIGFAGESAGRLLPPERCSRMQWPRMPIGEGLELTTIQIARAYATLANHGVRVDPYVVKAISNPDGETLYEHKASTNKVRVVSRKTADCTCSILEGAVKADDLKGMDGYRDNDPPSIAKALVPPRATGRRAAVKGICIAGKTATIQRVTPDSYEYEPDKFISSFVGIFPAGEPKYVLVACFETMRIDGDPYIHQGGGRPAMAFAETVRRMGFGNLTDDGK